ERTAAERAATTRRRRRAMSPGVSCFMMLLLAPPFLVAPVLSIPAWPRSAPCPGAVLRSPLRVEVFVGTRRAAVHEMPTSAGTPCEVATEPQPDARERPIRRACGFRRPWRARAGASAMSAAVLCAAARAPAIG